MYYEILLLKKIWDLGLINIFFTKEMKSNKC